MAQHPQHFITDRTSPVDTVRGGRVWADVLLVAVTLLAAAGWLFSKHALEGLPPLLFMGVRFLLAAVVLGSIGGRAVARESARNLLLACLPGVVMAGAMMSWILGLQRAENIGVGAFICSLGVILVPVMGWLLFEARVTASTWVAALVASAGMGFLFLDGGLQVSPADAYFLGTACGLAVQLNLNARVVVRMSALALTTVQLAVVGVVLMSASALSEHWPQAVAGQTIGWVLASSLLATSLRFFLLFNAQRVASAAHAALIMTLEPVWTALIAVTLLGERMRGRQLAGCSLIFLALLISRWKWLQGLLRGRDVHGVPSIAAGTQGVRQ